MGKNDKTVSAPASNVLGPISAAGDVSCDPPKKSPASTALMEALQRYDAMRMEVEGSKRKARKPEPPRDVDVSIVPLEEDLPDGSKRSILTCLDGRYVLWRDYLNSKRWRWSLRNWPDDDRGTANHGAGTLHECVQACVFHFAEHNPGVEIPVE